jgi:hypothetical protein
MVVTLVVTGAYASDNPFDLKENFSKLDNDEAIMLQSLKKVTYHNAFNKKTTNHAKNSEKSKTKMSPKNVVEKSLPPKVKVINKPITESRLDAIREKAMAEARQEAAKKEKLKQEKLTHADKVHEVSVHVNRASDKLDKEAKIKEALEREAALQKKAHEEMLAKKNKKRSVNKTKQIEIVKKSAVKHIEVKKVITSIEDINITLEKNKAKIAADKAYAEAVKEMEEGDE